MVVRLYWLVIACLPLALAISPELWNLTFHTSVQQGDGNIVLRIERSLAPLGVDRLWELVESGYYYNNSFFRVVPGFMVQFGIAGDPSVSKYWDMRPILDDPVTSVNLRGTISYATVGNNTRTTRLFINYGDNSGLDACGFTPFGKVIVGMDIADRIFSGYGQQPVQDQIYQEGNCYLEEKFPKLDYILKTSYVVLNSSTTPAFLGGSIFIAFVALLLTLALVVMSIRYFAPPIETALLPDVAVPLASLLPDHGEESSDVGTMETSSAAPADASL